MSIRSGDYLILYSDYCVLYPSVAKTGGLQSQGI